MLRIFSARPATAPDIISPAVHTLRDAARQAATNQSASEAANLRHLALVAADRGDHAIATHLEQQATLATQVAAAAMADAVAFQNEADYLLSVLAADQIPLAAAKAPTATDNGATRPLKPELITLEWSQTLPPAKTHARANVVLLDFGDRGRATITANAILLSGPLGNDPRAILRAVRHAQLNWKEPVAFTGNEDQRFHFAVAAELLGVRAERDHRVPKSRRAEADRLAAQWQPLLAELGTQRPPGTRSQTSGTPGFALA
jgi:hypothetical protein